MFLLGVTSGGLMLAAPAAAQSRSSEGFTIEATSRVRYEIIEGQARAGVNASDDLLSIRTTLAAGWRRDRWRVVAEIYDSRAYLADRGTPLSTSEVNALELVQAYIARDFSIGRGGTATVLAGRVMLNLGSRRLVAADDYRNTTNSYTGIKADLALAGGLIATAIYTLPQQRRPDTLDAVLDNRVGIDRESFDVVLWGGLVNQARALGDAALEATFIHFGERDTPGRPTRDRSLDTAGARLIREPGPGHVDYEVEGFLQFGRVSTGLAATAPTQQVSASFIHVEAGYSWNAAWKPRVSIEYDHASGDRPGGRNGRFDTLLGMRRAELAPAGLYSAIGRANISSPALRVEVTPSRRVDGFVSIRPMWLASRTDAFSTTNVRDATGRSGSYAGDQIDARVRFWAIPKRLRLEIDGVVLQRERFLEQAPGTAGRGDTRYLSFNALASF